MKLNIKKVKKYRRYTKEFKQSIVKQFENGQSSTKELSIENNVAQQLIYSWIYKFSNFNDKDYRIVENTKSSAVKLKEILKENQKLKAVIGEKQIKIEYLEKLIEIADSELNVDIKKNSST